MRGKRQNGAARVVVIGLCLIAILLAAPGALFASVLIARAEPAQAPPRIEAVRFEPTQAPPVVPPPAEQEADGHEVADCPESGEAHEPMLHAEGATAHDRSGPVSVPREWSADAAFSSCGRPPTGPPPERR